MSTGETDNKPGFSALILGATGAVGKHTLSALLANPAFTSVHEYGRRVTPDLSNPKLTQKTIDFDNLHKADFEKGFDVVYITLGTTRKAAGSAAAFEKIDRGYVVKAGEIARVKDNQHIVYLSSAGASTSSPLLYPKSKGLTEQALSGLGYKTTTIFRPGFLAEAERGESRILEPAIACIAGAISRFSSSIQIPVSQLGPAIVRAGLLRAQGKDAELQCGNIAKLGKEGQEALILGNADSLKIAQSVSNS